MDVLVVWLKLDLVKSRGWDRERGGETNFNLLVELAIVSLEKWVDFNVVLIVGFS